MARAKTRTPALRDKVLATAAEILAADGVPGFTTRRIAESAATSTPAVYELFGDKAGIVRAVFYEGFKRLGDRFAELASSGDPVADLMGVMKAYRSFVQDNPHLAEVMFSRPFAEFGPGEEELRAAAVVRETVLGLVRGCIAEGRIAGDETDIAHVFICCAQGLAAAETAGRLGTTEETMRRRWELATAALVAGLAPQVADGHVAVAGSTAG